MIRAYLHQELSGFSLSIAIVNHHGDEGTLPASFLRRLPDGAACRWELVEDQTMKIEPVLTLDDSSAHALLDALTQHYHGAEDTRALRRDYDAERGRVDRLTDALIGVAQGAVAVAQGSVAGLA